MIVHKRNDKTGSRSNSGARRGGQGEGREVVEGDERNNKRRSDGPRSFRKGIASLHGNLPLPTNGAFDKRQPAQGRKSGLVELRGRGGSVFPEHDVVTALVDWRYLLGTCIGMGVGGYGWQAKSAKEIKDSLYAGQGSAQVSWGYSIVRGYLDLPAG
ncbi:hypothetical protein NUW58_g10427 [Xylaria curta]|uniref:Uncharacterized protein n=1 Tax=Xylaria curta TaxID=42375 RepID=A0ACC1ML39_9PEZI|nr:hypothetical protein NUW58_g10427 [Xylaria curta]